MEQTSIQKLLEIVPPYPGIRIFHISDRETLLSRTIFDFCEERDYEYDLMAMDSAFQNRLEKEGIEAETFDWKKHRYNKHAKLYDYVFVSIDPSKIADWPLFLKKIYMIMKNSAKLLLFLPPKESTERFEALLEAGNFVAINPIDLFSDYRLLSAQKMHGWGIYDFK